ncbi:MAG: VOC family protein [Pseudomonadales bacterium]|nr:VOC family protein [Pseudomonadales bacterium]
MSTPNGINHVAYCTKDMKAQLEFFTDVVGLELKGLFWMHGVEGAMHAFLRLNDDCCFSFVQTADAAEREPVQGLTYPSWGGDAVAWGTLQHIALNVADEAALLAMRDRIRARGHAVSDPIPHGFCTSIYMTAPEHILLEFSTMVRDFDATELDMEVVRQCGISPAELDRMMQRTPAEA